MSKIIIPNFEKFLREHPEIQIEQTDTLLEAKSRILLQNTDQGRKDRAKHDVRTKPIGSTLYDRKKNIWFIEYNFRSYPSVENKRHWGYIMYDDTHEDILEMFCDCKDFFYRLYAPMVKKRLANWNLDWQFRNNPNKEAKNPNEKITDKRWTTGEAKYRRRVVMPHNRKWTIKTNPDGKVFLCKHLTKLITDYRY